MPYNKDSSGYGFAMTKNELINAVRKDIIGELEAIIQYDGHYNSTDNVVAKKVWADIRDEEKVHVGELFTLLNYLDPGEAKFFIEGQEEVKELLGELNIKI